MENEENRKSDESFNAQNIEIVPLKAASDEFLSSEFNEPRWAVISFEEREAADLTYDEAARKLQELAGNGVFGLCIITNEAAAKAARKSNDK